ncbi:MAG TPA: hypothetical protein VK559_01285 [Ferruginibacter sp.]|nr:hypothetical protein [Ferruginibacter sp.]
MKKNCIQKLKGKFIWLFIPIMIFFFATWFMQGYPPKIFFTLSKYSISDQFDTYFSIGLLIAIIGSKSSIKNLKIKNMKGLLKASIATLVLAATSATTFAADLNNTQSSSLSGAAAVGGVALLVFLLVAPTVKANDKIAH